MENDNMSLDIIKPSLRNLPLSKTLAISALAKKLKAEGQNVLNLAVGEPDFDTPEFVGRAAIDAINQEKQNTLVGGTLARKRRFVINLNAIINSFWDRSSDSL